MIDNSQPVTLVTGASSGLGLDFARLAAADGQRLILAARRETEMRGLAAELKERHGTQSLVIAQDLSYPGAAQDLIDRIDAAGWPIDQVISNAGFSVAGAFKEADPDRLHGMINVNILALTDLARILLPRMTERGSGRILNVASIAGYLPGPGMAAYYATKAYVLSLSEALWQETKGTGVTVTALCPGPVKTGFQATAGMENHAVVKDGLVKMLDAADVARIGYEGMKAGLRVVNGSWMDWASVRLLSVVPKAVVLPVVANMVHKER